MTDHTLILQGPFAEISILADILKRHLRIDANQSTNAVILEDLPAPNLEQWERAHVLQAVWNQAMNSPCMALMLIAGLTHSEAHDAFNRAAAISGSFPPPEDKQEKSCSVH